MFIYLIFMLVFINRVEVLIFCICFKIYKILLLSVLNFLLNLIIWGFFGIVIVVFELVKIFVMDLFLYVLVIVVLVKYIWFICSVIVFKVGNWFKYLIFFYINLLMEVFDVNFNELLNKFNILLLVFWKDVFFFLKLIFGFLLNVLRFFRIYNM